MKPEQVRRIATMLPIADSGLPEGFNPITRSRHRKRIYRKLGLVTPAHSKVHQAIRTSIEKRNGEIHRFWNPRCGHYLDPGRIDWRKPPGKRRSRRWMSIPIEGPEGVTCQRCARMMRGTWPYCSKRLSEDPVVWVATHGEEVNILDWALVDGGDI